MSRLSALATSMPVSRLGQGRRATVAAPSDDIGSSSAVRREARATWLPLDAQTIELRSTPRSKR